MKKRNKFSYNPYKVFTCDMGEMVPIGLQEVLPGDTWRQSTTALVRLSPLVSPVMHPVHVVIHHWFVPFRLLWDDWEDFITGGPNGVSAPVYPTITSPVSVGWPIGSLADYLGVKPGVASREVSVLPFRAYVKIFNECYRDEDLVSALALSTASGADSITVTDLQKVAWPKDYFTSARPWEQKGAEVSLPLVGTSHVRHDAAEAASISVYSDQADAYRVMAASASTVQAGAGAGTEGNSLYVDGEDFEAPNVNELRFAMAWQRVLEARSRWGSRYTELLRAWGVKSADARLQRPEYLGGGKETIQFSEVLGTANDNLGTLGGHGIGAMRSNRFTKHFTEHGFVISLMFARPISLYADGLERLWNRRTREEFWQPELQHLGQQSVKYKELDFAHSTPDGTFGYQDRFDEFRRSVSSVAGEIRPGGILDTYTLARGFGSDPALNAALVTCDPTKDVFASTGEDGLIVMAHHKIQARRLVARTGSSFIK